MKIIVVAISLLTIALTENVNKTNMYKKEIFENISTSGLKNYIQLEQKENSTSGIFLGAEYNADSVVIYFKSYFTLLDHGHQKNRSEFSFVLTKFEYSARPFNFEIDNPDKLDDYKLIPLSLQGPIRFWGKRVQDHLKLGRTLDYYDSRADEMNFKKKIN